MTKTLRCEKYNEIVDIENNPCPHPDDYCRFRNMCIINYKFNESKHCKDKKEDKIENTR